MGWLDIAAPSVGNIKLIDDIAIAMIFMPSFGTFAQLQIRTCLKAHLESGANHGSENRHCNVT
jgi:hypothetical protein